MHGMLYSTAGSKGGCSDLKGIVLYPLQEGDRWLYIFYMFRTFVKSKHHKTFAYHSDYLGK